jgi:hypothetical protein
LHKVELGESSAFPRHFVPHRFFSRADEAATLLVFFSALFERRCQARLLQSSNKASGRVWFNEPSDPFGESVAMAR